MSPPMSPPASSHAAPADAPPAYIHWRTELDHTLRLAAPMALTQLGQIAMMTTDLVLLGRLGDRVVAAVALAHVVLFSAFVLGLGLVSAVAPLAACAGLAAVIAVLILQARERAAFARGTPR